MFEKLKEMRNKVRRELEYIPDWPDPQNELRMLFWSKRMNSLGKKATIKKSAKEVLEECMLYLKNDYPNFEFKYDENFFK